MQYTTLISILENKIQDNLLFCTTVGSMVYQSDVTYCKDRDLVAITHHTEKILTYRYHNLLLDIQCFTEQHFLSLIQKQHIFFLEALFCPTHLQIVPNSFYLQQWTLQPSLLKIHTVENIQQTFAKSKKLFEIQDFQRAKKVFFHAYRVYEIYFQLMQNQSIDFTKLSNYSTFVDSEPISWNDWLDLFPLKFL